MAEQVSRDGCTRSVNIYAGVWRREEKRSAGEEPEQILGTQTVRQDMRGS